MTEHPTSHEGRQPLADRPQERTRPRPDAPAVPAPGDHGVLPDAAPSPRGVTTGGTESNQLALL
ncbi:hypothetical protein AB0C77_30605, partial [Streptomyces sp. NPDC048629]|uniref:hypothetical protein n=1 Tax=Streptomyces sp. NPDC048629 TaxID=3154824 RepID=UPI0034300B16